ncbi:hypothetical protein ACFSMW_20470, partial [Virgibacillus halophilus]|uniref:phage distal tail protein n=1 Tax=Tigheibacillus halophilus TaxID=361280 RepID=UPI00363918F9
MVQNDLDEYMLIGEPTDVDTEVVDEKTTIFDEVGDTLDSWDETSASQGSFIRGSRGIQVQSYGTGDAWHGPGLMKTLTTPIQDFELEFFINVRTERVDMPFRLSTNFYDEQMNEIGMLRVWDKSPKRMQKNAEGRIGEYLSQYENYLISDRNYHIPDQRVWSGILRVTREGNTITMYVARISQAGNHIESIRQVYVDNAKEYAGKLKYVRIDAAKYGEFDKPNEAGINRVKLSSLKRATIDQTPYIARPGDTITFDHKNEEILINGEDRKDLKDFGGSFFKLHKGFNQLVLHPDDSLQGEAAYRKRYR